MKRLRVLGFIFLDKILDVIIKLLGFSLFVYVICYYNPNNWKFQEQFSFARGFWEWLTGIIFRGDFGTFEKTGQQINGLLAAYFPKTAILVFGSLTLSVLFSIILIFIYLRFKERKLIQMLFASLNLFSGIHVLILSFAIAILLGPGKSPLPVMIFILAFGSSALSDLFYSLREDIEKILRHDYVRAARGRGMNVWKHMSNEIALTIIGHFNSRIPAFIGGTILVERVFNYKAFGYFIVDAIEAQSIYACLGVTVFAGGMVLLANLVSAIVTGMINPRLSGVV